MIYADALHLREHGAQRYAGAITSVLEELNSALNGVPANQAGVRLNGIKHLRHLLASAGSLGAHATRVLGQACEPVRAILFDKSEASNWSLPWHQDRTIAVAERIDLEGFSAWTIKAGIYHVEPPPALQAGMLTLRFHLDPVSKGNAPLLIAPGSHCAGRIEQADIAGIVARCGQVACLAEAGDVWAYSTPILHASERAMAPSHRRVLQVDYATGVLPGGLTWLGV
jgi:hypothetical protein